MGFCLLWEKDVSVINTYYLEVKSMSFHGQQRADESKYGMDYTPQTVFILWPSLSGVLMGTVGKVICIMLFSSQLKSTTLCF